jgi:hypothetical protein
LGLKNEINSSKNIRTVIEHGMEISMLSAFNKGNSPESISIFNDIPLATVQNILRKHGRIV